MSDLSARCHWLDWLRFLAAFGVLAVHARAGSWVSYARLPDDQQGLLAAMFFAVTRLGDEMVLLFFVLSGFLVGGRLIGRCRQRTFSVKDYAIDRITRIWVPLVPALALTALVDSMLGNAPAGATLLGNLFGLQGAWSGYLYSNAALWSLTYEIWCYVLAGATGVLVVCKWQSWSALLVLAVLVLAVLVLAPMRTGFTLAWWIGAAGYFLRRPSWPQLMLGSVMSLAGVFVLELRSASEYPLALADSLAMVPRDSGLLVLAVGLTLVVSAASVMAPGGVRAAAFEAMGQRLAAFSYTLYLVHSPLLAWLDRAFGARAGCIDSASLLWFVAKLLVALMAAFGCYWLFEARTPQLRQWLKARWQHA